jgi:hypothetical protein
MRRNSFPAVAGLLVIGALAAGCGSSNDNSTTSTASLTKAEWIAKADAICKAGNAKQNAAEQQTFKQKPTQAQIQQFTTDTLLPNIQQQVNSIKALGTPSEQGAQANAVLASAQHAIDAVKADPSSLSQNNNNPFEETNKLAQAYGMKVCGSG